MNVVALVGAIMLTATAVAVVFVLRGTQQRISDPASDGETVLPADQEPVRP
jgi:hypothetical protein